MNLDDLIENTESIRIEKKDVINKKSKYKIVRVFFNTIKFFKMIFKLDISNLKEYGVLYFILTILNYFFSITFVCIILKSIISDKYLLISFVSIIIFLTLKKIIKIITKNKKDEQSN